MVLMWCLHGTYVVLHDASMVFTWCYLVLVWHSSGAYVVLCGMCMTDGGAWWHRSASRAPHSLFSELPRILGSQHGRKFSLHTRSGLSLLWQARWRLSRSPGFCAPPSAGTELGRGCRPLGAPRNASLGAQAGACQQSPGPVCRTAPGLRLPCLRSVTVSALRAPWGPCE